MPAYTTPLYKAIEYAGNNGLKDYPIFDEDYRDYLNQRILEHYDEQEIGLSTPQEFVFALRRRMFEVMPKYNQLYLSERLTIDPLNTVNMKTVFDSDTGLTSDQTVNATGTDSSNSTSTGTEGNTTDSVTENKARTTNSNMPQVRLSGNKDYATSGSDVISGIDTQVSSDTSSSATGTTTGSSESATSGNTKSNENVHTENTEKGWTGNQSEMLLTFRQTFMNIDLMVIQELGDLFMLLWNTSDDYENKGFGFGY